MEPLAVDVREAGRLLSISPRTIRRHIQSGRIKAVRVGRRILVPVEALMQTLSEAARQEPRRDESVSRPPTD
jgi:excisionase family DNA binding protein